MTAATSAPVTARAGGRLSRAGVLRAAAVFGVLLAIAAAPLEAWVFNAAIFTLMFAALGVAWNLIGGYAGYTSLGHVAFFGVGAYALGLTFTGSTLDSGLEPFWALPLVGAAVAVATLPVAWVALRTRAVTFAIVTLTLLFIVQSLAFNLTWLTGGAQGVALPAPPFPLDFFERPFYLAMLAMLALAMLVSWWTLGSRLGLHLLAVRDDEDKARGVGVRTETVKLIAFAASAGLTAMVGGAWAYYIAFIYPQFAINPLITLGTVLMVFLGGRGTLWGPVVGALILVPAQQYLAYRLGDSQFYLIGYAAVFLAVILLLPRGILPSLHELLERRRGRGRTAFDAVAAGDGTAGDAAVSGDRTIPSAGAVAHGGAGDEARAGADVPSSRLAVQDPGGVTVPAPAPSVPPYGEPLLVVEGLAKRFGGVAAVDRCSFEVPRGSITALIGPNGSGKTTVFNLVTGYLKPDAGTVLFAGRPAPRDPAELYRRGLVRTFQQARVFGGLTVRDNLLAAAPIPRRRLLGHRAPRRDLERADELLADFGLTRLADVPAARASYGQRKLLEFAMVMMGEPRLILLDEPAAGVNPTMINTMERHVRALNARGVTFLIVEHDMSLVMRLCAPVIVLDQGAPIAAGPPERVRADPRVLDAYLGA